MRSVEPKLAGGICAAIVINISVLIEFVSGFPLFSEHNIYVFIFGSIALTIVYIISAYKYDRDDNDNAKAFVFGLFLILIFLILAYKTWST